MERRGIGLLKKQNEAAALSQDLPPSLSESMVGAVSVGMPRAKNVTRLDVYGVERRGIRP